jgi:excisionase family DNA binding protein
MSTRNEVVVSGRWKGEEIMAHAFERLTITVEEAARLLGVSRGSAYEAARRGDIPTIRLGKRLIVPVKGLEALLESAGRTSDRRDSRE